jgi:hypothetical protein
MAVALTAALALLFYKRQFAILFAYAGMTMLPAIRMAQYSYMKYYVLLPFLVVIAFPRLGMRFAYPGLLGALLLISNTGNIWRDIRDSRELRLHVAQDLYPRVPTLVFSRRVGVHRSQTGQARS